MQEQNTLAALSSSWYVTLAYFHYSYWVCGSTADEDDKIKSGK